MTMPAFYKQLIYNILPCWETELMLSKLFRVKRQSNRHLSPDPQFAFN